jgi:hypothetical protein
MRKKRSTEDVLKEQEARARTDRENAVAVSSKNALAADDTNPWIEIGNELDKFLGAPLLKFTKQGEFALSDVDIVPGGTRCIAHCDAIELGWISGKTVSPLIARSV